jgi:hypothetical protein
MSEAPLHAPHHARRCEWGADYHTDTPHLLDYSKLPSGQQRQAFVRQYLAALLAGLGVAVQQEERQGRQEDGASSWRPPQFSGAGRLGLQQWVQQYQGEEGRRQGLLPAAAFAALAADLVAASGAYLAVSHAHWALWGYIQARSSNVDFDFLAYADQRMEELGL